MDAIKDWWAAIMAAGGIGVWLVRLEGNTKSAIRDIDRLERQMADDREASRQNRQEQNEMLREMRADIKRLLERGNHQ